MLARRADLGGELGPAMPGLVLVNGIDTIMKIKDGKDLTIESLSPHRFGDGVDRRSIME